MKPKPLKRKMTMKEKPVELFTSEENVIIAEWFSVDPVTNAVDLPSISDALETLGFVGKASAYSEEDAAVGAIVLERVQKILPQWSAVRQEENGETSFVRGREIKARHARRIVELVPQHLMTINWADNAPGFSWPVAYYVTWVPIYNRYVVTQSADCPDVCGYCDFAIGHFQATDNFVSVAGEIIRDDWYWLHNQYSQSRWAYLFSDGLIDEATCIGLREEVWDEEPA
jgi:hypothetical protein